MSSAKESEKKARAGSPGLRGVHPGKIGCFVRTLTAGNDGDDLASAGVYFDFEFAAAVYGVDGPDGRVILGFEDGEENLTATHRCQGIGFRLRLTDEGTGCGGVGRLGDDLQDLASVSVELKFGFCFGLAEI